MEKIQLSDLLAIYPEQNERGIQARITAKKEFYDLRSSISEPPPEVRGDKRSKIIKLLL